MGTQPHKKLKILLIGDSCVDTYTMGFCKRISPEAPVLIFDEVKTIIKEGMLLNVYNNLKAFDVFNIDVFTNNKEESSLSTKRRLIDIKTNQHVLRIDTPPLEQARPAELSNIFKKQTDSKQYVAVIISDYNKGFITQPFLEELMGMDVGKIFVDSKRDNLEMLKNCYVKINENEYDSVHGLSDDKNIVVTTLGAGGCRYKNNVYKTIPQDVYDVTGAGDTFFAAFIYGVLMGDEHCWNMDRILEFSNKCASNAVKKMGVYVLTKENIQDALSG